MDSEFLEWATNESNDRFLFELSDDFIQMLDNANENITSEIDNELDALERHFTSMTSLKQQESTIKRLRTFLELKKNCLPTFLIYLPLKVLNNYLRYFYSELRTADGNLYAQVFYMEQVFQKIGFRQNRKLVKTIWTI